MPFIRCTQKLLKEMGVDIRSLQDSRPSETILGDWYANRIKISRPGCLLFVNERALFSFLVLGVPKSKLSNLKEIFTDTLRQTLIQEDIDKQIIEKILAQYDTYDTIEYEKTNNRNIVSSMRYIAFMYEQLILLRGGIGECNVQEIIHDINRTIHKNIGWKYPHKVVKEMIASCHTI